MASSPERSQAQLIPPSVNYDNNNNNNNNNNDHDLLDSLDKLVISSPGSENKPSTSQHTTASSNRNDEPRPCSVSSSPRPHPRSSVAHEIPSETRSTTPSLLRKASMNSLKSANGTTPSRITSRRASSTSFLSPTSAKHSLFPPYVQAVEERPQLTAASVARAYFAKELELLHSTTAGQPAETVVILHDDCYGHRYSRPRASKNLLSTIVERPERIQASVLGVSMAYVRLGERHAEGKHPIHADLDPKTLPGIPFRIHKTTRKVSITSTAVTNVHGTKWMEELKLMCDSAEAKLALNGNELRRPEMNRPADAEPPQHLHQGDLYLCSESLNAFEGALGAVCEAVDAVFSTSSPHKRAFVAVRPPGHHCSASFPSGFCWVNNVHVGIMHGILNHGLTHAAIIDFDLHHGDGSQTIAWQHNKRGLAKNAAAWKKTSIGYFSVHDINSYPCEYGDEDKVKNASLCIDNAHGQNIWNVHLHEWKSDVEFWTLYQSKYSILLEKTRSYLRLQTERFRASGQVPKAAIFLSAGFDASEWEGAGMQRHKVNVPTEFYARLTRDVVRIASEEGLSVQGRVISVLEGGYSDRALYSGVLSHLSGLAGVDSMTPKEEGTDGAARETDSKFGPFRRRSTVNEMELKSLKALEFPYDPNWWSVAELDLFDAVRTASPPPEVKKTRFIPQGNYSSPTQASNAKMTEVAKSRRSMSNVSASQTMLSPRSPTPPPPDVSWTAAAHELSKLLIPDDRQIASCKHSELNTEATKARRDRQSLQIAPMSGTDDVPAAPPAPTRMSLRERKPVSYVHEDDSQSRRKTLGGPTALKVRSIPREQGSNGNQHMQVSTHDMGLQLDTKQPRQTSRRLSAASILSSVADVPLPTSTTSERLDSSLSMRPDSSMSVSTQPSTVSGGKKTRPAAPPRKPRAPRAPRKAKSVTTKVGTESSAAITQPTPNTGGEDGFPFENVSPSAAATPDPSIELEQITDGMKKIRINVLTAEQKEAREKAKGEMAAVGVITTPKAESPLIRQPPPLQAATELNLAQTGTGSHGTPTSTVEVGTSYQGLDKTTPTDFENRPMAPMTPTIINPTEPSLSSTPFLSSPPVQPPSEPTQGMDLFVPYQPEGPPPKSISIQGPVQILEPNTGTPAKPNVMQPPRLQSYSLPVSPVRRGHGFTATSSIPFSPGPAPSMSKNTIPGLPRPTVKTEDAPSDIWEIPETPEHQ